MPVTVAVVVPCKNEVATIGACIEALHAQRPVPRVIVVDNGSDDGSLEVAHSLADEVLQIDGGTIAGLRNSGAARAPQAEVLGFVDSDVVVGPGWLAAAVEGLRTATLVGSRMDAPQDGTWVQRRWAALEGGGAGSQDNVWSGHMAIRASVFTRLNGFDTTLATGEDSDLSERVRALGGQVRQISQMHAVHHGFPVSLGAMWRRERWHSRTPGFWHRLSSRSRLLVAGSAAWMAVGLLACAWSLITLTPVPVLGWVVLTAAGVAGAGALVSRSVRHAVPEGTLLGVWATARALRLPRELLHLRRGAGPAKGGPAVRQRQDSMNGENR